MTAKALARNGLSGLAYPPRVVSGVQPSLNIHLGHYFGAMQNLIRLQHEYPGDTFYLIADWHALSHGARRETVREGILKLATTLLAVGLDPNKCILYRQSDVPEGMELVWYFSCLMKGSQLLRRAEKEPPTLPGEAANAGNLLYPLLMAADVLCLRSTMIATGHDQQANAQTVRDVADRFNRVSDREVFPIPEARYSGDHVVPGTDGQKMNSRCDNYIGLFEPFFRLKEQVDRIVTDSKGLREPKDPDSCTVFRLYSLVASPERCEEMAEGYRQGQMGYGEAKIELVRALQEYFAASESKYHDLEGRPDFVMDILREGVRQAREEARHTLEIVRDLFGIGA